MGIGRGEAIDVVRFGRFALGVRLLSFGAPSVISRNRNEQSSEMGVASAEVQKVWEYFFVCKYEGVIERKRVDVPGRVLSHRLGNE